MSEASPFSQVTTEFQDACRGFFHRTCFYCLHIHTHSPAAGLRGNAVILFRWSLYWFGFEVVDKSSKHTLNAVDMFLACLQILIHLVYHLLGVF